MSESSKPDERALRAHIAAGPFQSGVDRGWWRLITIEWPYVIIAVSATPQEKWPSEYDFRFECSNYPQDPATAQPWDLDRNAPLDSSKWPTGRLRIPLAFNPGWKGGQCLYLPCDRLSIEGHAGWVNQHPHMIWKANSSDITLYLGILHDLLNSSDYTGPRSA